MTIIDMYSTDDDVFIWNEFLAGNDRAYEFIYNKYVQALFTYGLTITCDEDLVKDCIHDVFIPLYENRKNLRTTNNIKLYLLAALKNSILMTFRKQQSYRRIKNSIFQEYREESDTIIDEIINSEEEAEQQALVKHIWTLLTSRQKEIVYYRFVAGLSLNEIAEQQNIGYQSVANILYRSIKKIKKFYSKSD